MKEAGRAGGRAVAVLIVDDRGVGTGFSDAAVDRGDQASLSPPNVDHRLARGDNDAALERIVDYLATWAKAPRPNVEPEPGGEEGRTSG